MRFRYILFDMDGLLVDSEQLTYRVLCDLLSEFGKTMTPAFYADLIGHSNVEADEIIALSYPEIPNATASIVPAFAKKLANNELETKHGAAELLDYLEQRGISKSLVSSNTRSNCDMTLDSVGFSGRFDHIVSADLVARCKPAPDLLEKALELYGAAPEECLVLEDSVAGILAANAAGIPVIMVPDLLQPDDNLRARCLAVCDSLAGVIPYLS